MKRIIDKNLFFVKNKDFHTIVIRVIFPMYEFEKDLAKNIEDLRLSIQVI